MENKGFEYINTIIHPNKTEEIVLESKHKIIGIHFIKWWKKGVYVKDNVSISIKDKRTNQNKNYDFSLIDGHNIPNKYESIIIPFINKKLL